ncbi:hypothetical protein [uncultured Arcobacter sp.]|nr:hypothetical protein [uncultured Arcobacter sp.]
MASIKKSIEQQIDEEYKELLDINKIFQNKSDALNSLMAKYYEGKNK